MLQRQWENAPGKRELAMNSSRKELRGRWLIWINEMAQAAGSGSQLIINRIE
jgi:hypothetical protein